MVDWMVVAQVKVTCVVAAVVAVEVTWQDVVKAPSSLEMGTLMDVGTDLTSVISAELEAET